MSAIDQLRYQMISYENQMGIHVSNLETIESDLSAVASHSSTCQVLRDAYSELEDPIVSDSFADPKSNLNHNIATIRSIRGML